MELLGIVDSPFVKYFSFILLGLMMSIGWVMWRLFGKKKKEREGPGLEKFLSEAEAEALQQARARRERKQVDEEALALSPKQELELQRVEKLVRGHEGPGSADEPDTGPDQETNSNLKNQQ